VTDPVIIQTRDRAGRTIISVYDDVHEAERQNPIAWAGPSQGVFVAPECDPVIGGQIKRLSENELVHDPWQDLSWLCTHTRDGDGYITPITRTLGGAA
jgi:hypothetical protein